VDFFYYSGNVDIYIKDKSTIIAFFPNFISIVIKSIGKSIDAKSIFALLKNIMAISFLLV
jgi:hypothetical protein